jgi:hypothetical protein
MKFMVEVGDLEKHTVEFKFNQLLGRSTVAVDGQVVFSKKRWFSEPVFDNYEVEIGGRESVRLRIEKRRRQLLGAKYTVYVDDRLSGLFQGV